MPSTSSRRYTRPGLMIAHCSYLNGGGLRSQQYVIVDVECIVGVSCGVTLEGVQHVEAVLGVLYLGTVNYRIAHAVEDGFQVVQDNIHRVALCDKAALSGHSYVYGLGLQAQVGESGFQRTGLVLDCILDVSAYLVRKLTDDGALLSGKPAHLLQDSRKFALFAEESYAERVYLLHISAFGDCLERFLSYRL